MLCKLIIELKQRGEILFRLVDERQYGLIDISEREVELILAKQPHLVEYLFEVHSLYGAAIFLGRIKVCMLKIFFDLLK